MTCAVRHPCGCRQPTPPSPATDAMVIAVAALVRAQPGIALTQVPAVLGKMHYRTPRSFECAITNACASGRLEGVTIARDDVRRLYPAGAR